MLCFTSIEETTVYKISLNILAKELNDKHFTAIHEVMTPCSPVQSYAKYKLSRLPI